MEYRPNSNSKQTSDILQKRTADIPPESTDNELREYHMQKVISHWVVPRHAEYNIHRTSKIVRKMACREISDICISKRGWVFYGKFINENYLREFWSHFT
jgi:hypothetical protein